MGDDSRSKEGEDGVSEKEGCLGHWIYSTDGNEYDCDYEFAGEANCEDCLFGACGGTFDPRYDRDNQPKKEDRRYVGMEESSVG